MTAASAALATLKSPGKRVSVSKLPSGPVRLIVCTPVSNAEVPCQSASLPRTERETTASGLRPDTSRKSRRPHSSSTMMTPRAECSSSKSSALAWKYSSKVLW